VEYSKLYLSGSLCMHSVCALDASAGHEGWSELVILAASLTYPFILVWRRPKTGFWNGALQLLLIIVIALICAFITYLLWYASCQYNRLGNEFHLLESLGWTFAESLRFFIVLEAIPSTIITVVCYPIGYLSSHLLFSKLFKAESQ
jgi:magnesium-transporting ATPase (P-type)